MSNKSVSFQLDISAAGLVVLQTIAMKAVDQSASAIASRAQAMASSMTSQGITFGTNSQVGIIKRGQRAIATVAAIDADTEHLAYLAYLALLKARDAGRVN